MHDMNKMQNKDKTQPRKEPHNLSPKMARVRVTNMASYIWVLQPTKQVPTWQYVAPKPTSQAPMWWHADLREDPATTPAQQPASLHGAARLVGLDAWRSKAKRPRTGWASLPSPIK